jgi:hypothetical protein
VRPAFPRAARRFAWNLVEKDDELIGDLPARSMSHGGPGIVPIGNLLALHETETRTDQFLCSLGTRHERG